jgi:hypothetical protein
MESCLEGPTLQCGRDKKAYCTGRYCWKFRKGLARLTARWQLTFFTREEKLGILVVERPWLHGRKSVGIREMLKAIRNKGSPLTDIPKYTCTHTYMCMAFKHKCACTHTYSLHTQMYMCAHMYTHLNTHSCILHPGNFQLL